MPLAKDALAYYRRFPCTRNPKQPGGEQVHRVVDQAVQVFVPPHDGEVQQGQDRLKLMTSLDFFVLQLRQWFAQAV